MKFVLLAIIAFHFANFGEANVSLSPLIPDYCSCAYLWTQNTMNFLGLFGQIRLGKLAKKIIQTWDNDGCFDIDDLKNMFNVGHSIITFE